ncbi:MAG TPA: GlxA family transcriptional regulator [Acidimicrobiales bacterium]|nr:GlxA family transcriptional regulator [Acidimicrobiales bacterium]
MTRRVVFVAFDDFQILDLTGPLEVCSMASRIDGGPHPAYRTEVATLVGEPLRASCGLEIRPDRALAAVRGGIDTLVVIGGAGTRRALESPELVGWVGRAAGRSRRVVSVCSGAYLLAAAGLLDGKRATTHWAHCDRLAEAFPAVVVERDPIFVHDGDVWTSAGVTAGMDLMLRLVEDDLGADTARAVARELVLFVQRPGGQAQFSTQLAAQRPAASALRAIESWIPDHLDEDLAVPVLAARCAMSPRHFARAFRAELGVTPGSYVGAMRVEAARRLLETTGRGIGDIARACGFGTIETLHRCFKRTLGVTPGQYRDRFSPERRTA